MGTSSSSMEEMKGDLGGMGESLVLRVDEDEGVLLDDEGDDDDGEGERYRFP